MESWMIWSSLVPHSSSPNQQLHSQKRHNILCLNREGCLFPKKTHEQVLDGRKHHKTINHWENQWKNKAKTLQKHSKHIPETIQKPSKHYQHPRSLSWNAWWKPSWRRSAALSLVAHLGWRRLRPRCGLRRCCPRRRRRCHSRRSSGGGGPGIAYRALRRGQWSVQRCLKYRDIAHSQLMLVDSVESGGIIIVDECWLVVHM